MTPYLYSIALVIASQIAYQLAMKAVPVATNPFTILGVVYGLAAAACIALAPLTGTRLSLAGFQRLLTWPTALLALAVVGIEVGYLLAYRSGWTLGSTFAVTSVATVSVLALLGVAWFGESLDARRILGIALALVGGWLVVRRA